MASRPSSTPALAEAVETAVKDLVSVRHWGGASFASLPLYYPSGAPVTVRISGGGGKFYLDDAGFAYRELESVGAQRSFHKAAAREAEDEEVQCTNRTVFVHADAAELARAISDIGMASWSIVHSVFSRLAEGGEEIAEYLRDRLTKIFGPTHIEPDDKIIGSSTQEWEVSAILKWQGERTVFQAVADSPISIYRTSTAFHDLAALPNPPGLVAVVRNREALGKRLSLLSQIGRVIESAQPDDVYQRAAS